MELLFRFLLGGLFVSFFAILGDSFKPKCFAGLFGAAPSIAMAGLLLTGIPAAPEVPKLETHAMIFGAVAMLVYSLTCYLIVKKTRFPPGIDAVVLWGEWLLIAFGFYFLGVA